MTLPGSITNLVPGGHDWIAKELKKLRRDLDALRTATPAGAFRLVTGHASLSNFAYTAVGGSLPELLSLSLTVPPGQWASGFVMASGTMCATTTAANSIHGQVSIAGQTPAAVAQQDLTPDGTSGDSLYATLASTFAVTLGAPTSGSTIDVELLGGASSSIFPPRAANTLDLVAFAIFSRV